MHRLLIALLLSCLAAVTAQAEEFDHQLWDGLLRQHVTTAMQGQATWVDYNGMQADRGQLQNYLESLSAVTPASFEQWPAAEQLAFLINAYNAWTVELILTGWPDIESIKELGSLFRSPWRKAFILLLGATRSLDDIEHKLIRGSDRYREPRIHFAVNCASIGCPALRAEAYVGSRLEQQLQEQTRNFLADRSRNRLRGDTLELSSIFKWYREDFEKGWQGYQRLADFLLRYADALELPPAATAKLQAGKLDIDFLAYDWKLNAKN